MEPSPVKEFDRAVVAFSLPVIRSTINDGLRIKTRVLNIDGEFELGLRTATLMSSGPMGGPERSFGVHHPLVVHSVSYLPSMNEYRHHSDTRLQAIAMVEMTVTRSTESGER